MTAEGSKERNTRLKPASENRPFRLLTGLRRCQSGASASLAITNPPWVSVAPVAKNKATAIIGQTHWATASPVHWITGAWPVQSARTLASMTRKK